MTHHYSHYPHTPTPTPTPPQQQRVNGMSIGSFIASLIGVSIVGLVLGIVSLEQMKRRREQGQGFAIAGITLGVAGSVFWVFLLVGIVALGDELMTTDPMEAGPHETVAVTEPTEPGGDPSSTDDSITVHPPSSGPDSGTEAPDGYTTQFCSAFMHAVDAWLTFMNEHQGTRIETPNDLPDEFRAAIVKAADLDSPNQAFYRELADALLGNVNVSADELNTLLIEFNRVAAKDVRPCRELV